MSGIANSISHAVLHNPWLIPVSIGSTLFMLAVAFGCGILLDRLCWFDGLFRKEVERRRQSDRLASDRLGTIKAIAVILKGQEQQTAVVRAEVDRISNITRTAIDETARSVSATRARGQSEESGE